MNRDLNKEKPLCRGVEAGAPGRELQGQRLGDGAQSTSRGQLGQCGWRVGVGVRGELGRVGTDPCPGLALQTLGSSLNWCCLQGPGLSHWGAEAQELPAQ